MKFNLISTKEILDFEKEIGIEIVVNERKEYSKGCKYYVKFEHSEIMEGGSLIGSYGNGDTIDEALENYCKEIQNKRMAFNAYTPNRREVVCPKFTHTKRLGR